MSSDESHPYARQIASNKAARALIKAPPSRVFQTKYRGRCRLKGGKKPLQLKTHRVKCELGSGGEGPVYATFSIQFLPLIFDMLDTSLDHYAASRRVDGDAQAAVMYLSTVR